MAVIPNSCRECNQHDCINHQFEWFMKNNPNINNANSVSPACPLLKEVSQEPTTKNDLGVDAVSRKAVINQIFYSTDNNGDVVLGSALRERIARLPSITPQPRKGHWVHGEYCSECGCDVPAYIVDWRWQKDMDAKYCPNCGCRMVEPQESEVEDGSDD